MDVRRVIVAFALLPLVGCGTASITPTETEGTGPSVAVSAAPITLPGPEALLPDDAVEAVSWVQMSSLPNDFDPEGGYASPSDLADAFGAAIDAAYAGSPQEPDLKLDPFVESEDHAVLIISETGLGDDSVVGSQYALVVSRGAGGWVLDDIWTRALCRRGVSDQLCV
ncbi:MAG: hypothetical protein ACRDG7_00470 [Candidatus Limnocylindria bacterium]